MEPGRQLGVRTSSDTGGSESRAHTPRRGNISTKLRNMAGILGKQPWSRCHSLAMPPRTALIENSAATPADLLLGSCLLRARGLRASLSMVNSKTPFWCSCCPVSPHCGQDAPCILEHSATQKHISAPTTVRDLSAN